MATPLELPTPLRFKKKAIRDDIAATLLADLGPNGSEQLKTVSTRVQVRDEADLRKVIPVKLLPAAYVVDALGEHVIGRSSTIIAYNAPTKHHVFDLRVNVLAIVQFNPKHDEPDELVAVLEEAILASLLADNLRGGTALFTEPIASAHTSYLFGDRVMYRLGLGTPFLFRRPVP